MSRTSAASLTDRPRSHTRTIASRCAEGTSSRSRSMHHAGVGGSVRIAVGRGRRTRAASRRTRRAWARRSRSMASLRAMHQSQPRTLPPPANSGRASAVRTLTQVVWTTSAASSLLPITRQAMNRRRPLVAANQRRHRLGVAVVPITRDQLDVRGLLAVRAVERGDGSGHGCCAPPSRTRTAAEKKIGSDGPGVVGGGACCLHRPKGAEWAAEAQGQGPDEVRSRSDA